jgi:uncharacterized protein YciI
MKANLSTLIKLCTFLRLGGAILNEEGKMIGSTMILQFESPEEFQHWIDAEPYIQEGVWEKFEVKPFRVANV